MELKSKVILILTPMNTAMKVGCIVGMVSGLAAIAISIYEHKKEQNAQKALDAIHYYLKGAESRLDKETNTDSKKCERKEEHK